MTNKMTPTHWFRIAGAGGILAALYVAWVVGDANDGHIGVSPQINAAAIVWPAAILATIVIIAGIAKLIAPLRKDVQATRSLLEQTRETHPPRAVGPDARGPDYTAGYVDGLAAQPTNGKVIQLDRR